MNKVFKALSNPQQLTRTPELKYWVFIVCLVFAIYTTFSNGDFSFLLTLSSLLSSLSFLGIYLQVQISDSGLSKCTFLLYTLVYLFRLCSILPYESYLPNDSTGDWLYQVIEILSFIQSAVLAYKVKLNKENPNFLAVGPLVFFFSLLVHPTLNRNFFTDSCWMASMLLEPFALVPLMWRVKQTNDFENFSSHFIAAQSMSKILSFTFWLDTYAELNKTYAKVYIFHYISGYFVVAAQLGTMGYTGHFLWYYLKSAVFGTPLVLPL